MAYPGFAAISEGPLAAKRAKKLWRPMSAASLQTDLFEISLVFHDAQLELVREGTATVSQVIFPIE